MRLEFSKIVKRQAVIRSCQKCEASGCNRPARGMAVNIALCSMHRQRWVKHGSVELINRKQSPNGLCVAEQCGRPIRSGNSSYCETHYYRIRRKSKAALNPIIKNCLQCKLPLEKNQSRFCCTLCGIRFGRGTPNTRNCTVCSKEFPTWESKEVCSDDCEKKRRHIWWRNSYSRLTEEGKDRLRQAEYKRKAQKIKTAIEDFSRTEIFERDAWTCGICKQPVPKTAKWPEADFATLDHIIPLARGGTHTKQNAQCAHLRCNIKKSDKILGRLI